jgi:hypothetical protein
VQWQDVLFLYIVVLAMKPVQLAMYAGQPATLSFCAGLASVCLHRRRSTYATVFLLSLSLIKPTIAVVFMVYFLVQRCWPVIFSTATIFLIMNIIIVMILPAGSFGVYIDSVRNSFATGSINDASNAGPTFFDISSLQSLIYVFTNNSILSTAMFIVSIAVFGMLVWKFRRIILTDAEASMILAAFASLFFLYHRSYDLMLVLLLFSVITPRQLFKRYPLPSLVLFILSLPLTGFVVRQMRDSSFDEQYPMWGHLVQLNTQIGTILLFALVLSVLWREWQYFTVRRVAKQV